MGNINRKKHPSFHQPKTHLKMVRRFQILFLSILSTITLIGTSCDSKKETTHQKTSNLSPKECIRHVIAMDDSLGTIRNHACEAISLSETIQAYVDGMKTIDFTDCPIAFEAAFRKHIQAWEEMKKHTDKYPNLRGEMHDLFKILEEKKDKEAFKPLLATIWDTWKELENAMQ